MSVNYPGGDKGTNWALVAAIAVVLVIIAGIVITVLTVGPECLLIHCVEVKR